MEERSAKQPGGWGSLFMLERGGRGVGWSAGQGTHGAAQGAWRGEAGGSQDEGNGELPWGQSLSRNEPQASPVCREAQPSLEGSRRAWLEGPISRF